jgi:signal transduction histidine kinase
MRSHRLVDAPTVIVQCLVALGCVALGVLLRIALAQMLSPDAFLVFIFSVILAARVGGLIAGFVTTAVGVIVGDYLFAPPDQAFGVVDLREASRMALFVMEGSTITLLFYFVRRSQLAERRARDQLKQFLGVVSHELRNPLAAITTSAGVLARRSGNDHASTVLLRQVGHLNRMVNDISELSRLQRAALDVHLSNVAVNELLESAADVVRPECEQRNQVLNVALLPEDTLVTGDPVRLRQVFANLLLNASRYSPAGSAIRFAAAHQDDRVVVTVADSGRGFAGEDIARLFEPFVRGATDQPGAGLGLAISKAIVEWHGGTIRGDSPGPGAGAIFTVTLVRRPRHQAAQAIDPIYAASKSRVTKLRA